MSESALVNPSDVRFSSSMAHEASLYHPAATSVFATVSSSSPPPPPPMNNPLTPSNLNSQLQQASPIHYATLLNSNSSGLGSPTTTPATNGARQQQYHRPLLRATDEPSNTGPVNSYDGKENRRTYSSSSLPHDGVLFL